MIRGFFRAGLLLLVMPVIGNPADAALLRVISQEQPVETCFRASRDDAVSTVARAVQLFANEGPEYAFRQFMLPGGGYVEGDLYVFVLDPAGTIIANGANPRSVGTNVLLAHDQYGHYFVKSILQQTLTRGKGWVDYQWISPCTGKLASKSSYCEKAGTFAICAGVYD